MRIILGSLPPMMETKMEFSKRYLLVRVTERGGGRGDKRERLRERKRLSPFLWFVFQMVTIAWAEPGQSQELLSGLPSAWAFHCCFSQAIIRSWVRRGAARPQTLYRLLTNL